METDTWNCSKRPKAECSKILMDVYQILYSLKDEWWSNICLRASPWIQVPVLRCDGPACCSFPRQWDCLKCEHGNVLFGGFVSCRQHDVLSIFTQLAVTNVAALDVLRANWPCFDWRRCCCISLRALWFVPWLKVVPRPLPFTRHALKVSPTHRCGHFYLSWLNLLGDSGGGLTDGSLLPALLPPIKRHRRNICFSRILVPARRQPEMRSEAE